MGIVAQLVRGEEIMNLWGGGGFRVVVHGFSGAEMMNVGGELGERCEWGGLGEK